MQSIRRGTALLDREYPEWYKAIDLDKLDLGSTDRCILGQLHPDSSWGYSDGLADLGVDGDAAHKYGFDLDWEDSDDDYVTLTWRWARAIKARLRRDR